MTRIFPLFASATILFVAFLAAFPSLAQGQEPAIVGFMRDSATLGFANVMLEEGLNPLSYPDFLGQKETIISAGSGTVTITKLSAFGQTVGATRNDPVTFYIEEKLNENIIEQVRTTAGEAFPFNYPFSVSPTGVATAPAFGPIPPPQDGVLLSVPSFSQTDPRWATNTLDGCSDTFWGAGCGPTSLAMVLKYFGNNVTPLQIGQPLKNRAEYFCGTGSSLLGLANIARDQYGLQYAPISSSEIETHLQQAHPIIGSFGCFGFPRLDGTTSCSNHISVIKGLGRCTIKGRTDTCVYFEDSFIAEGELAVFASTVIDRFQPNAFYVFSK